MLPAVKLNDKNESDDASPRQAFIKPCTGHLSPSCLATAVSPLNSCVAVPLSATDFRLSVTARQSHESRCHRQLSPVRPRLTLQALVYDILPSTTAVFSYAIGSRKLSANEQFFAGAQTVVSLLQTTQIKQGHLQPPTKFTPAQIKPQSFESGQNFFFLFFFYPGWTRLLFTCVLWR